MEYWKENVNYRQEKGPDGTRYLITVDGMDVEAEEAHPGAVFRQCPCAGICPEKRRVSPHYHIPVG